MKAKNENREMKAEREARGNGAGLQYMRYHDYLENLDQDQREAVCAPRGPTVILAGAGTGKTTTITMRIARMIVEMGVNPQHILALSFTTKAAQELRNRIYDLVGSGVTAQTFHSAAFRQLKYFSRQLGQDTSWKVLTHKTSFIRKIVQSTHPDAESNCGAILHQIEKAKCNDISPEVFAQFAQENRSDAIIEPQYVAEIYQRYEEQKHKENILDFDDLLIKLTELFERNPQVCDIFRSQYISFFVDEFQDLTLLQYRILLLWLGNREDITIVGDINQTIYSFAGADFSYLLEFPKHYPETQVIRLYRDYRSTRPITAMANQVIEQILIKTASSDIALQGQREEKHVPQVLEYQDERYETQAIIAECKRLMDSGIEVQHIAILYRINAQSTPFEEALLKQGIPYRIKDGISLLGHKRVEYVLKRFTQKLSELIQQHIELQILHLDEVLRSSGYDHLDKNPDKKDSGWYALAKLREILAVLITQEKYSAQQLLGYIELQQYNAATEDANALTLSTIHAAKGLEWLAVFLPRLIEGTLPYYRSGTGGLSPKILDEERRLFYVGITRAKVHLYLSWALRRYEQSSLQKKSRFLNSLG